MQQPAPYQPHHKIRLVTAASLFDGHDAAINIMRRIMQSSGAEIVHLGHNRSVQEIVDCAIQEDVQGIAITSYQGGHNEYFKYMYDLLQERGAGHIKIFGGGGGTILPEEIQDLHDYGITRIYHPDDGRAMGLQGMINDVLQKCDLPPAPSTGGGVTRTPPPVEGAGGRYYITADPIAYPLLKEYADKHKHNPTQAEAFLWEQLRGKQLEDYKFRRQQIVDQYITDFICLSKRLIVEVDGGIHQLPANKASDAARTQRLQELGYQVIRFTNEEVLFDTERVLTKIKAALAAAPMQHGSTPPAALDEARLLAKDNLYIAHLITVAENQPDLFENQIKPHLVSLPCGEGRGGVLGITGTGGAGKSSMVDELVRRFLLDFEDKTIAIVSVDPSKRKTGGALLGDRIRMNSINNPRVYMRSLATRQSNLALSKYVHAAVDILKAAQFDLIILETSGIGQSDTEIIDHSDVSLYIMTPEFGAATQLEKIDMLDFADVIAINKFDKRGALDALRDVRKQVQRNRNAWDKSVDDMPVFGCIASQFNDPGVNQLYRRTMDLLAEKCDPALRSDHVVGGGESEKIYIIPPARTRYLSEIAENNRAYDAWVEKQVRIARTLFSLNTAIQQFGGPNVLTNPRQAEQDLGKAQIPSSPPLRGGAGGEQHASYKPLGQLDSSEARTFTGRHAAGRTDHPDLKTFRKQLRANLTPAEAALWMALKDRRLDGRKFRRQHQVGPYILDFYCPEEQMAVELDGAEHFTLWGIDADVERDAFLEAYGIKVLRFENKMVFEQDEWLLEGIRQAFGWRQREGADGASAANTTVDAPPLPPLGEGGGSGAGVLGIRNVSHEGLQSALPLGADAPPLPPLGEGGRSVVASSSMKGRSPSQLPPSLRGGRGGEISSSTSTVLSTLWTEYQCLLKDLDPHNYELIKGWEEKKARYAAEQYIYLVRGKEIQVETHTESLSHLKIPKVCLPKWADWGEVLRWSLQENVPGEFPYTAGVFPFKREGEDPTRMFAGEGGPERTNRRFHYVSAGLPAARLSTAFDSVTLYGEDPDRRPDIYGKIGNSGVSVCCLDDAKKLYSGFDLCDPKTSVSMTINGPAATMAAFFMNAAIDQQCEKYIREQGLEHLVEAKLKEKYDDRNLPRPAYKYLPPAPSTGGGDSLSPHLAPSTGGGDSVPPPPVEGAGGRSLGLLLLGITGAEVLPLDVYNTLKAKALQSVRGTVQADILKEDQAQNTCIFSTEFSLRVMGDVQQYFIENKVRNFYSVSISGYHIAEAGANPISQLAFTLSNGFTFVEYYRSRGMHVDDFAPNLSFFFSNGVDPEYAVIGRVARRIWAKAMKRLYGANERSQMLKYHIQTSGRSLHAQEIAFNDIRTTLQALYAIYDNCNSLHTNAYDEAITTPTEESVRRAMAIQLIINKELGLAKNENPLQGAFIIEELTDLVEEAVLAEFDRITERGGVLGAMETMYQRGKIQEESLYYETLKHTGELPLVGVNTFLSKDGSPTILPAEVIRADEWEKEAQIETLENLHKTNALQAQQALRRLQQVAIANGNLFAELMEAAKVCSLGQITRALYEVGGQYRRNM